MVVRLETFVGRIPGTSYGDMLVFGTKIQEKKVVLLFGELDLNTMVLLCENDEKTSKTNLSLIGDLK